MTNATELLKLNLGCHSHAKKGYVNIDKDKYPGVDVVGDVFNLDMAPNTASEIYVSNILEHCHHTKTLEVLKSWNKILAPGGVLKISVPDFRRALDIYLQRGLEDWVVNFLWGDQVYDGAFHYCAFDEARLTRLLREAGFTDISRCEFLPGAGKDCCSTLVSNIDGKPVCLNMIAVKI
jgi:SAM-dependent methyltransferase